MRAHDFRHIRKARLQYLCHRRDLLRLGDVQHLIDALVRREDRVPGFAHRHAGAEKRIVEGDRMQKFFDEKPPFGVQKNVPAVCRT